MKTAIKVGKIINIPIEIDISWVIIFGLLAISLSEGYFLKDIANVSAANRWLLGIAATLLFFVSLLIHELSHSYVAQKSGISIKKITLFIFGGVAQITREPDDPATELKIAAAGPAASIALGVIFLAVILPFMGPGFKPSSGSLGVKMIVELFGYLSLINFLLAAFNLVPAFPLDGGRILRAIIWSATKNFEKATRVASYCGQAFAFLLMFFGVMQVFGGRFINGVWLIFIGWFLNNAASTSWQQVVLRHTIAKNEVEDLMTTYVITARPDASIEDVIENSFLHYRHIAIPVVENEVVSGILTLHAAKSVPKEKRHTTIVKEVMKPIDQHLYIYPHTTIVEALNKMQMEEIGRLLVIDENKKLKGILTRSDILKFIQIKIELE